MLRHWKLLLKIKYKKFNNLNLITLLWINSSQIHVKDLVNTKTLELNFDCNCFYKTFTNFLIIFFNNFKKIPVVTNCLKFTLCTRKQIKLTLGFFFINNHFINGYTNVSIKWHINLPYVLVRPIISYHTDLIITYN